jgi:hypothetical protein
MHDLLAAVCHVSHFDNAAAAAALLTSFSPAAQTVSRCGPKDGRMDGRKEKDEDEEDEYEDFPPPLKEKEETSAAAVPLFFLSFVYANRSHTSKSCLRDVARAQFVCTQTAQFFPRCIISFNRTLCNNVRRSTPDDSLKGRASKKAETELGATDAVNI